MQLYRIVHLAAYHKIVTKIILLLIDRTVYDVSAIIEGSQTGIRRTDLPISTTSLPITSS